MNGTPQTTVLPEDLVKAVKALYPAANEPGSPIWPPYGNNEKAVALAIAEARAAERERCSKIVEDECVYIVGRIQASVIAGKIRNG